MDLQAISRNLNQFLIENFNTLLRQEEKALSRYGEGVLSIYEFHVIDAAYSLKAVKTLERKGYVRRVKKGQDRRQVWLEPTARSEGPFLLHRGFHEEMVRAVLERLKPEELTILDEALRVLADYFSAAPPALRPATEQPPKN